MTTLPSSSASDAVARRELPADQHVGSTADAFEERVRANNEYVMQLDGLPALGVTDNNRLAIRQAIQRFANATSTKTDGSWTVVNLVKESGVSRATLYRDLYAGELQAFDGLASVAPLSSTGLRGQLRETKRRLAEEKVAAREERKRHQEAEDIMLERIHALTLMVASALGKNGVPVLFPEFAKRKTSGDQG